MVDSKNFEKLHPMAMNKSTNVTKQAYVSIMDVTASDKFTFEKTKLKNDSGKTGD